MFFRSWKKVENLKSRQTKESLRKLNQMDFDPHDVTREEIDEITKNPIFDENNISDFILNEYGVEKRNIILVIILRFCSDQGSTDGLVRGQGRRRPADVCIQRDI